MKDIRDMTTQELLEAVDGEADLKRAEKNNHVSKFIIDFGIIPGSDMVPNYLIYYTYHRLWRKRSINKVSKIDFFRKFNNYFDSKRTKNKRQYMLDGSIFDRTRETDEKAKNFSKRYDKKISKKREQKRQGKISRSGEEV